MTDALHGADTTALRRQAAALHEAAGELTACARRTGEALETLRWHGQDAVRARDEWATLHARVLLVCAQRMQEAALRLLDEADGQEAASAAGTGAGAAPGPVSGTASSTDGLRAAIDRAHDVVGQALGHLGHVTTVTDVGAVAAAAARWGNITTATPYRVLDQAFGIMQDAQIGPAVGGVLQGAAAVGVVSDAYGAYRAYGEGDLHGMVDNGVSAVLGAGGFVPGLGLGSAALGVSWSAGTWAGTEINEAMQGTDFHARFTERMQPAFELGGAAGVLNTPGALLVTAGEEVGIQAQSLWRALTGPGDGTLDPRR
ncbi:hypothetical protein [Cellulomonas phragmiteti]|uniref:WXG100 family type VII secretion target n=1 Tax=Cellulomonas phragmiteti TaxID=478780 RepID=A0ABQ4DL70_9CELL|nr:hypothetical protein [Cellulomonas phragmiteti]GIG40090.1 hypothetical protein Cph01nite_18520 [Cellulomonas phragmiteti]